MKWSWTHSGTDACSLKGWIPVVGRKHSGICNSQGQSNTINVVSLYCAWVLFHLGEKDNLLSWWFYVAISQFSFSYVAGPRACLWGAWNSFPLKEKPASTVEKNEWDGMVGLAICYEVQKSIKQSRGWGLQMCIHLRRHSPEASTFSWFFFFFSMKQVSGRSRAGKFVWSASTLWIARPVGFQTEGQTHSLVMYSHGVDRNYHQE